MAYDILYETIDNSSSSPSSLDLQPVAMTERDKSRYTEGSISVRVPRLVRAEAACGGRQAAGGARATRTINNTRLTLMRMDALWVPSDEGRRRPARAVGAEVTIRRRGARCVRATLLTGSQWRRRPTVWRQAARVAPHPAAPALPRPPPPAARRTIPPPPATRHLVAPLHRPPKNFPHRAGKIDGAARPLNKFGKTHGAPAASLSPHTARARAPRPGRRRHHSESWCTPPAPDNRDEIAITAENRLLLRFFVPFSIFQ
ncbi:hypothetical protein EVAR_45094_1 [Eumeta japonica]|uniref:Uncharacterized protein n=1 Tax=Eumeta variegata TaxID=151549 RepID=A0A4C1YKA5_EUMVA|nr:hypothetical protein EVAR_45094_1 [Eumeta japonica]